MKNKKILIFDLETGPNLSYTWAKWQQDVIAFKEEWKLLSFSYKWLGEKKTTAAGQDKFTEEQLILRLHQLFDEADVLIAHNAKSFDIKKANAKFLEYNLNPPSPYEVVDTLLVSRKYFKLNSNKLNDLGKLLKVGVKVETGGFDLWLGCMAGNKRSWQTMLRYNKQDVVLLEKVYRRLLPWIENHPAMNLFGKPEACPKCGKGPLHARGTRKTTKTGTYQRWQCQSCGGWSHSRKSVRVDNLYVN